MNVEDIARVCHEVNRGYCHATGDDSQSAWEDAPDWQRQSAINGVRFALEHPLATPEDSHKNWLKEKQDAGWVWGPVKDPELREHPCMLPYQRLPVGQRVKDHLFLATVRSLAPRLTPAGDEITIPVWGPAADRCNAGIGSLLDQFVWNHEPAGEEHEAQFRSELAALLRWAREQ